MLMRFRAGETNDVSRVLGCDSHPSLKIQGHFPSTMKSDRLCPVKSMWDNGPGIGDKSLRISH